MAKSCDEWWMIYCDVWDHVLLIGITTCMSMSMTTGRSHRSCLYSFIWPACHQETPCKLLYFIAKRVSHRSRSSRWRDNFMKTQWWRSWWWRSWCQAGDKMIMEPQDGDQRSYVILVISCHFYYLIACDVYHVYASCLLRKTVVNKMIPYKISRSVLP